MIHQIIHSKLQLQIGIYITKKCKSVPRRVGIVERNVVRQNSPPLCTILGRFPGFLLRQSLTIHSSESVIFLDKNQTCIGSVLPFMLIGPLYCKWN